MAKALEENPAIEEMPDMPMELAVQDADAPVCLKVQTCRIGRREIGKRGGRPQE